MLTTPLPLDFFAGFFAFFALVDFGVFGVFFCTLGVFFAGVAGFFFFLGDYNIQQIPQVQKFIVFSSLKQTKPKCD